MERDTMGVTCSTHEVYEECIQNLVGRTDGEKPLERHRFRCEDNNKKLDI